MVGISPEKRVDSRFLLDLFEPAYLALDRSGERGPSRIGPDTRHQPSSLLDSHQADG